MRELPGPGRFAALALLVSLVARPVTASDKEPTEISKVDRWTTKADFHGIVVLVGVRLLTVKHRPYSYIPLQLSVSNYGKTSLKLDVKAFKLKDEDGHEFPVATWDEIRKEHKLLQYDKERSRAFGFDDLDQTPATVVRSRFYPVQGEPVDPNIELLTSERIVDLIYFRNDEKISLTKLTLTIEGMIDAPGLRIPLEIPAPE
ncbi:MAG: hypothetical protein U0166_19025 [Acidobacteriota bacterium]